MSELPTGTVTFLFTDLEGSTRLWEEQPEAMKAALARHDEILRAAVESHGGHVVKTTGDGLHAAFATARDAAVAAVDAQRALMTEPWDRATPLRVRMGVHTGESEERDGDYFGAAPNRAARLSAAAHGGQALVSLATEELIRDALDDEITLLDLGEHRLRDLSRLERVFQLNASGLATEHPPLRSLDALPGNLPVQVTSFVGRGTELSGVARALREARLVTIVGVGGVGKTRLAAQVAAEILTDHADGAWLCEMAAATDSDTMAQVVAATLGVTPRPGMTLPESIADFLRTKRLLLVLDNCEHLTDAVGHLVDLVLRRCPEVRVLATSREGLAVAGEQMWALRSLPVPAPGAPADEVARNDAVLLFTERARAVRSGFSVDVSNAEAVRDICGRLDGIPLALELAAARSGSMSPSEIAGFLDERFRLLTGGRRTAVERHQTLRATVDWSYSLLDERGRRVFDRLGVFAGSFDAAAASAVVAGDDIELWDVLDALDDLVAKSMVVAEETRGTTRYQLLETLRAYARERLDETGDADAYRRRHAEHFAGFAEEAGPAFLGLGELTWRDQYMLELDNVRAAVAWALDAAENPDQEIALRVIAALSNYTLADPTLLSDWPDRALAHFSTTTLDGWGSVLAAASQVAATRGDGEATGALALRAIQAASGADTATSVVAYGALSYSAAMAGDYPAARSAATEGVRAAVAIGDSFGQIILHSYAAYWASQFQDTDHARESAEAALVLARDLGNPSALVAALGAVGYVLEREDAESALGALRESAVVGRTGVGRTFGISLAVAARLHARRGESSEVFAALREAIGWSADSGDRSILVFELNCAVDALNAVDVHDVASVLAGIVDGGELAPTAIARGSREETEQAGVRSELEAALGSGAYESARARGAAMSYEQAVEFVINELGRLMDEAPDA